MGRGSNPSITSKKNHKTKINFDGTLLTLNWYREKDPRTSLGAAYIYSYVQQVLKFETENEIGFVEYDVRNNLNLAVHKIIS